MTAEIMAFDATRRRNSQAIVDAMMLGWVDSPCVDLTYGLGRFWGARPDRMVRCDINPTLDVDVVCDFRSTPFTDHSFRAVVFDPPYKLNGRGGSCAEDAGYGVADGWDDRRDLYADGIAEAARIVQRGGHVLVKGQDQIAGGYLRSFAAVVIPMAERHGLRPIGQLHVAGVTRPQPSGRPQRSPRNATSTLLAFRSARKAPA
ncbi:MAG: hypothetical protein KA129_11140 [Microthrixaceae bacterium]|nr:hypothetical protein [Microthrixaceae bacterium]